MPVYPLFGPVSGPVLTLGHCCAHAQDKLAGGAVVMDPKWLHSQMRQMMVDRVLGTRHDAVC